MRPGYRSVIPRAGRLPVAAIAFAGLLAVGCSGPRYLTAPQDIGSDTTIAPADLAERQMQERANLVMAALGDAYRVSTEAEIVTDDAVAILRDGFAFTALEAEEANLRDALDFRNALARTPADPELFIDVVTEEIPGCQVAEAIFDDRPLLAFPTAVDGQPVFVRMLQSPDDDVWRVDVLVSPEQAEGNPVTCPLGAIPAPESPSTSTTITPKTT
jgi:hypothetical protein